MILALVAAAIALAHPHFPARPGWYTGTSPVHACPGVPLTRCASATAWAATVRWRDCAECNPHLTVSRMLPRDIAIRVTSSSETNPPRWIKPMRWPPPLRPIAGFEGLPGRVAIAQVEIGFVHGYETTVWVYFGRARPTSAQVALARLVLRSAQLPRR